MHLHHALVAQERVLVEDVDVGERQRVEVADHRSDRVLHRVPSSPSQPTLGMNSIERPAAHASTSSRIAYSASPLIVASTTSRR
jgi:hypothetical protein